MTALAEFLSYVLMVVAAFAIYQGIYLLSASPQKLLPTIKKQLLKKENSEPTEEELDKKVKQYRMWGVVSLAAGGILIALILTGGI